MIGLVTFDFWQTLFADSPGGLRAAHDLRLAGVREALLRAGHRYDAPAVSAADARALVRLEVVWAGEGSITAAQQLRLLLEALDPALPETLSPAAWAAVARAYEEPALSFPPVLAPGAAEAVQTLRAGGLGLGVVSNTGRTPGSVLRQILARAGILEAFAVLSFSDEVGSRKPAPAIFLDTVAAAGVTPGEAVHLGDDPVRDVAGARRAGLRAIHYAPAGDPPAPGADGVLRHFADLPGVVAALA